MHGSDLLVQVYSGISHSDSVTVVPSFYFYFRGVRKTGPRSNKIKQMRKQNTEDTQYKRDTDLRGSPSVGYVHQRNCQVLSLLLSSKMKGYNLQQNPL
jgi:hypothetical protein